MAKEEKITIKQLETPDHFDNTEIKFEVDGKLIGFGFIIKKTKEIGLIRCPECGKENYGPNVTTGICSFCGFNANQCAIK